MAAIAEAVASTFVAECIGGKKAPRAGEWRGKRVADPIALQHDDAQHGSNKLRMFTVLTGSPHFGETNPLTDPIAAPSARGHVRLVRCGYHAAGPRGRGGAPFPRDHVMKALRVAKWRRSRVDDILDRYVCVRAERISTQARIRLVAGASS
jgi:hypothetical protein